MAVKEELLQKLANPENFVQSAKDLRCNVDAIKCVEAVISEDPKFNYTGFTFDKTQPQPYICYADSEGGMYLLCWNSDVSIIGFRVKHQFITFNSNPDVVQYCQALTKVIDEEMAQFKRDLVNGFCEHLHFGSTSEISNEFQKYLGEYLSACNETRKTPVEQQYDLDDLAIKDIKTILDTYCTVESNVHFVEKD